MYPNFLLLCFILALAGFTDGCTTNDDCSAQTQCQRGSWCNTTTHICTIVNRYNGYPCNTCAGDPLSCLCVDGQCVGYTCVVTADCFRDSCMLASCNDDHCTRLTPEHNRTDGVRDVDNNYMGYCLVGECVMCTLDEDCPTLSCNLASCYHGECVYTPTGDGQSCSNCSDDPLAMCNCSAGSCGQCGNAADGTPCDQCALGEAGPCMCINATCTLFQCDVAGDCPARPCHTASCDGDRVCGYIIEADQTACGVNGTCTNGTCIPECTEDSQCVRAGCEGTCVDTACSFACGPNCTHAIGWWYQHAATAFPPIAPITVGTATITTPTELRSLLRNGFGSNALDALAAAVSLVELNVLAGAIEPPALAYLMASPVGILECCPQGNSTVWIQALAFGGCCDNPAAYSIFNIRTYTQILLRFSNGQGGVPLCNDIGAVNPI
jgi:hypothetical protein